MFPANPSFVSAADRSAWFIVQGPTQTVCETTGLAAIVAIQGNIIRRLGGRMYRDFRNQPFDSRAVKVNGRFDDATLKGLWIAARERMLDVPPPSWRGLDANAITYRLAIACAQHNVTPLVLQAGLWLAFGTDGGSVPVGSGDITTIQLATTTVLPRYNQAPPVPVSRSGIAMRCRGTIFENEAGSGFPRVTSPAGALRPAGGIDSTRIAMHRATGGRPVVSVFRWNEVMAGQVPPARWPLQWGLGPQPVTGPLGASGQIGPPGAEGCG